MRKLFLVSLIILLSLGLPIYGAQPLKVKAKQNFIITLESNATTGYSWQLAKPLNKKLVKYLGSKYYARRTGLVGSGGVERWVFRALKKGDTRIFFKYVRPWEKKVPPVAVRDYRIFIR